MQQVNVAVLGAGAAGMMAAFEAGRRGRRVLLLDHAERAGNKILISGGGRCNFTNLHTGPENFLSENHHFARSALARFTPRDMIALVEKHRVRFHEKTLGQLFCDGSAREIVMLLEAECAAAGVGVQLSTRVEGVRPGRGQKADGFTLETSSGLVQAESVIVATGGLSIPKLGASGFGYELARQFSLRVIAPRPALVPFTLHPADRDAWCELSGVSAFAETSIPESARPGGDAKPGSARGRQRAPSFREKLLITHRGVSGPAILQISSYWRDSLPVTVDLAPDREVFTPLLQPDSRRDAAAALAALRTVLPARWAERWLELHLPPGPRGKLSTAAIAQLERGLHAWSLMPAGTEGFAKAEVTAGGVDTAELDARTLESRKVAGLYFIGEVVDVTGWLGGYNFQWAWASAVAAGQSA